MPYTVACPICGTDGTAAANLAIAQSIPAQPSIVVAPPPPPIAPMRAATPPPLPSSPSSIARRNVAGIPQKDPEQIRHEANAKISWGDSQEEVIKFMMMNGFPLEEARSTVAEMFQARANTIRKNGFGKMMISIPLMCVPVVAFFIFSSAGYFPVKLFGLTVMVGLYGFWLLLKGSIMFISPKSETGDVADK